METLPLTHLINYIERKQSHAKDRANQAKRYGNETEQVAWNHTYLAYEDVILHIKSVMTEQ